MTHLDADTLTDLGAALAWREDLLDHLARCFECRERFHDLGVMHRSLEPASALRPGFAEAVAASLPAAATPAARVTGVLWSSARAIFGAGIAVATLGLAAAQGAALHVDLLMIGGAAVVGAIGAWRMSDSLLAG